MDKDHKIINKKLHGNRYFYSIFHIFEANMSCSRKIKA